MEALRTQKIADVIATHIEKLILEGALRPGECRRLTEGERDALNRLRGQGGSPIMRQLPTVQ